MPGALLCRITARIQLALTAGLMALFHSVQCLCAVSGMQAINSHQFVHLGSPGKCTGPVWASLQSQYPMQEGWLVSRKPRRTTAAINLAYSYASRCQTTNRIAA